MATPKTSIRLTDEDRRILAALERKLSLSNSDLIRVAIRLLAERESVTPTPARKRPAK
jgi:hypothetical protein